MDINKKEFPNKNISKGSISKRKKSSKIPEYFAYPNDEAGLPQSVPNLQPIPETLLDYSRQELRLAIKVNNSNYCKNQINTFIEWAIPYSNESLKYRKTILNIP